jgi:NAD(P)-dependent dehydrogenase (short-subunit alcohol dehydrogenase family)
LLLNFIFIQHNTQSRVPKPKEMATPGPSFIVGTGPMSGSKIPRLFASKTFTQIALFARSEATLTASKERIAASAPSATIKTYIADVIDAGNLTEALKKAVIELGSPEVVVYNPVRINYVSFDDYNEEEILMDFKIVNLGLYSTAKMLLPHLRALAHQKPETHPCFFITSAPLIHHPFPIVFSLSMAKAAQASLAKTLADKEKDVVHVALVTVWGPVTFEEPLNNPVNVAVKFWEAWEQKKGEWTFEHKVE